jgi:hypothetical protein
MERKLVVTQEDQISISCAAVKMVLQREPLCFDPAPVNDPKKEQFLDSAYEGGVLINQMNKSKLSDGGSFPKRGVAFIYQGEHCGMDAITPTILSKSTLNVQTQCHTQRTAMDYFLLGEKMKAKAQEFSGLFQIMIQPLNVAELKKTMASKMMHLTIELSKNNHVELPPRMIEAYAMEAAAFQMVTNKLNWPQEVKDKRNNNLLSYFIERCIPVAHQKYMELTDTKQRSKKKIRPIQIGAQDPEEIIVDIVKNQCHKMFVSKIGFEEETIYFSKDIFKQLPLDAVQSYLRQAEVKRKTLLKQTSPTDWFRTGETKESRKSYGETRKPWCFVVQFLQLPDSLRKLILDRLNKIDEKFQLEATSNIRQVLQQHYNDMYNHPDKEKLNQLVMDEIECLNENQVRNVLQYARDQKKTDNNEESSFSTQDDSLNAGSPEMSNESSPTTSNARKNFPTMSPIQKRLFCR